MHAMLREHGVSLQSKLRIYIANLLGMEPESKTSGPLQSMFKIKLPASGTKEHDAQSLAAARIQGTWRRKQATAQTKPQSAARWSSHEGALLSLVLSLVHLAGSLQRRSCQGGHVFCKGMAVRDCTTGGVPLFDAALLRL